jgi:hypothetical protein
MKRDAINAGCIVFLLVFCSGLLLNPVQKKLLSLWSRFDVFSINKWMEVIDKKTEEPEILPQSVNLINRYFRDNEINDFRISDKVRENVVLYQRLLEGVYPVAVSEHSAYHVIRADEELVNDEELILKANEINLIKIED